MILKQIEQKFDVFAAVKMLIMVFWVVMLCSLIASYQHISVTYLYCEDGSSMFLW
jgi:hypothetical protein